MGPYVQGDGFYVLCKPPTEFTGRKPGTTPFARLVNETAGWHCDAYNHHNMWRKNPDYVDDLSSGRQLFTPPLAAHMPCYLQDMDGLGGPMIVVPWSHRSAVGDRPVGTEKEQVVAVDARAGDVVFFHCDMLHSGSENWAKTGWRYMITSFVVRAGLPYRNNFMKCSLVRALIAEV